MRAEDSLAAPAATPPPTTSARPIPAIVPLRGAAVRIAANMAVSLTVPTATSFRDIPVATLEARRAQLNRLLAARPEGSGPSKLSLTHLVAYAVAQAAAARPRMLVAYAEPDGVPSRIEPTTVNLGLAVDVESRDGERNLLVPVVRDAGDLDFATFVVRYDDLVGRARSMRL